MNAARPRPSSGLGGKEGVQSAAAVVVETPDLPFRLTALPPWPKVWSESELSDLDIDPACHRGAGGGAHRPAWREMVGQTLRGRLEG